MNYKTIEKIYDKKRKRIKDLNELKIILFPIMFKMLLDNKDYTYIHKKILQETINYKKAKKFKINDVFMAFDKVLSKAVKKRNQTFVMLPLIINKTKEEKKIFVEKKITESLTENEILNIIDKEINKNSRDLETEEKEKIIKEEIKKNSIFYLVSEHEDSALDHKDFQGKIYYNDKFQDLIKDKELKNKVQDFILKNNLKSIQWVIDRPVWMLTRPNCRHYFDDVSIEEVFNFSASELIKKKRMHHKTGKRGNFQTLKHDTKKGWYTEQNIKSIINKYKERLKLFEEMAKVKETPTLKRSIKKTKLLINKWQNYLKSGIV